MEEQEGQKPFVVLLSYTLPNPNTMVIKSWPTHITSSAMFRSRRLECLTSFTLLLGSVKNLIIVLLVFFTIKFFIIFSNLPWRHWTCFVINPETKQTKNLSKGYLVLSNILIRHENHNSLQIIKYEPSTRSNHNIKYLYKRVISFHDVMLHLSEPVEDPFSEHSLDEITILNNGYPTLAGSVPKKRRLSFPRIPGSLGLTQTKRQTKEPITKYTRMMIAIIIWIIK